MKFYRYIVCAFLFIGAAIAETININWLNDGETYAQTTCEIGGDVILPTTPTKRGYTFVGWQKPGYTRLEYIESSGTQYIDTGVTPKYTDVLEMNMSIAAAGKSFAGATSIIDTSSAASDSYRFEIANISGHSNWGAGNGKNTTKAVLDITEGLDNYYVFNISNTGVKVDDVQKASWTATAHTTSATLKLFTANAANTSYGVARIKYAKLYSGGTPVREMVPAKRNSDSVIGMYDSVTETFFTNAGTGEFIVEPAAENQNMNKGM